MAKSVIFRRVGGKIIPIVTVGNVSKPLTSMAGKLHRVRRLRNISRYDPDASPAISKKMMNASKKEGKELAFILRQTIKSLKKKL